MALTETEKAVFEYRLNIAKKALKKKRIRFYSPALNALPKEVRGNLTAVQLRNTMNAELKNMQALIALEQIAGIESPELQPVAA